MALVDCCQNNFEILTAPTDLPGTSRGVGLKHKTALRDLCVSEVQNSQPNVSSSFSPSVDDLTADLQRLQIRSPCRVTKLDRTTKRSEYDGIHPTGPTSQRQSVRSCFDDLKTVPESDQQIASETQPLSQNKRQHYIELPSESHSIHLI
jgi:hypothetical protein